jgi:hypothetical protein
MFNFQLNAYADVDVGKFKCNVGNKIAPWFKKKTEWFASLQNLRYIVESGHLRSHTLNVTSANVTATGPCIIMCHFIR